MEGSVAGNGDDSVFVIHKAETTQTTHSFARSCRNRKKQNVDGVRLRPRWNYDCIRLMFEFAVQHRVTRRERAAARLDDVQFLLMYVSLP